ncbi:MAG: hypothetical protein JNN15_19630 [Blastocatellia bacterium]|nr:hypothetical protein [Blastocatellia bacterium]
MGIIEEFSVTQWQNFGKQYWGKNPVVLKTEPLATAAEAFQALINMCDAYRAGEEGPTSETLRLAVEHRKLEADVHRHLPMAEDGSVAQYGARLERELQTKSFFIYARDIQVHSPLLWERARDFLKGLFDEVGMPAGHVELEIFFGRYEFTTGGIHRENCSNLHCVLEGHKRMRVWPKDDLSIGSSAMNRAEVYASYLDATNIKSYLDRAVTLDGRAGDILYWPAEAWHVGEAPELCLCLNIALYMEGKASDLVTNIMSSLVSARLGSTDHVTSYRLDTNSNTKQALPKEIEKTVKTLLDISSSTALSGLIAAEWLKRLTGFGFEKLPRQSSQITLPDEAIICGNAKYPILWMQPNEEELVYASNGYTASVPPRFGITNLIERLNQGEPIVVAELLCGDSSPEELRAILGILYAMRAITVC